MATHKIILIILAIVLAVAAVGIAIFFAIASRGPYKGSVVEKGTGNPVPNVSVSDGRNVVKTDENGKFTLKGYTKTRFITVTAPSGYIADKFYISANKNTKSYDFTLKRSDIPAGAEHSFLQISDTEVDENGVGEWKNDILKYIDENDPAFLIHTGDICYEAGLKTHYGDMNSENMGLPVYYTIGNHDYVDGKYGEELYESIYGPVWYSFEVGNVHYVVTPFQWGDKLSRYNKNDRWRWLENDLKNTDPNMNVIMFNHTSPNDMPMSDDYVLKFDLKQLDLKEHNLIAWVYGHYHYNYIGENSGILDISTSRPDCGGIDQSPASSRLVSVDKSGGVSTKLLYLAYSENNGITPKNTKWLTKVDGNTMYCDTVFNNGRIYIATADDDWPRSCGIYCINAYDGSVIWEYETKNSVKNNIIITEGKAITQDVDGNVYCLNAESGELIWETQVDLKTSLSTDMGICVDEGTVYAGCAVKITALNLNDGSKIFEKNRKKGECSPASLLVKGNKLILSSHWDALIALDKTNGKELWKSTDNDLWARSSTPAIVDDNTLLVAESDAIMEVDINTGQVKRKSKFENHGFSTASTPLIIDNIAYIATAKSGVIAYSLESHEILWNVNTKPSLICTPPYVGVANTVETTIVQDGDCVVFAASDGYIYRVKMTDGSVVDEINTGCPIISTVAVNGKSIYTSDFSGRVICISK